MDPKNLPSGGPAFPTENARQTGHTTWHYEGMTVRDYFAAKALQAIIAADGTNQWERRAEDAYAAADAMLAAR